MKSPINLSKFSLSHELDLVLECSLHKTQRAVILCLNQVNRSQLRTAWSSHFILVVNVLLNTWLDNLKCQPSSPPNPQWGGGGGGAPLSPLLQPLWVRGRRRLTFQSKGLGNVFNGYLYLHSSIKFKRQRNTQPKSAQGIVPKDTHSTLYEHSLFKIGCGSPKNSHNIT